MQSRSGTTNYGYTSDGQVSSQGSSGYTWNGLGQLATATVGSNTVTYSYDPTGALMQRSSSSPATTVDYPLDNLFETNGSGTIVDCFIDGPAGNLARYTGPPTSSSTVTYLYYDGHGNLAAEANSSGAITGNHTYDPFGALLDSIPSNLIAQRFVGRWKQYDTTTDLVFMGARLYDPTTGRFLANDPIPGGSLNNYDYAGQDPINGYDLAGTFCFTCEAGAVWREFKATASTALPIVAGAAVLTVCPECFVVAGIAAGATSFVARVGFDHSSPKQAAIGAAIDAIATLGQARLEKVLFKQLDKLLVTYAMRDVPDIRLYYMFKEINYDRGVAFHHR